jgi:hypothetical protein
MMKVRNDGIIEMSSDELQRLLECRTTASFFDGIGRYSPIQIAQIALNLVDAGAELCCLCENVGCSLNIAITAIRLYKASQQQNKMTIVIDLADGPAKQ